MANNYKKLGEKLQELYNLAHWELDTFLDETVIQQYHAIKECCEKIEWLRSDIKIIY